MLVGLEQLKIQVLQTDSVTVNHLKDTKICICFGALQRISLLQSVIKTAEVVPENKMVDTRHSNNMVI